MSTLLEKAKAAVPKKVNKQLLSDEEYELCVAWAMGDITTGQVALAINRNQSDSSVYYLITKAFKRYVSETTKK